MKYYITSDTNGNVIGYSNCPNYSQDTICIEITKEEWFNVKTYGTNYYRYKDNKIVPNPDYQLEQAKAREKQFNERFFNTSLGYVRRSVTMKNGYAKEFLTDILPLLQVGIPIITYEKPDFATEELPKQNTNKIVTEEFINECKQQVLIDFYGAN